MLYSESVSVCSVIQSLYIVSPRTGLCPPLCVWVSCNVLLQNHLHTDVWVAMWEFTMPPPRSVKNKLKMCDTWLPWWCFWEWRQSGSGCTTCGCKNVVNTADSTAQVMHWYCPFPSSPCCRAVSMYIHTLKVFCYCCANSFKLMNFQVPTCPYTSLTGLIIHCQVGTQPCWPYCPCALFSIV